MSRMKFHVKKGDEVEVISGNFKGSTGKVLDIMARKHRVVIEGVRMIKRHLKKSQDNPQGKIAEREGPIHISNVKVVERQEREGKGKGAKRSATKGKTEKAAKTSSRRTKAAKEKPTREEA